MKQILKEKISGRECMICKKESNIVSRLYDGLGVERQLYYCKNCIFGKKIYDYPILMVKDHNIKQKCSKCGHKSSWIINNNLYFCNIHISET